MFLEDSKRARVVILNITSFLLHVRSLCSASGIFGKVLDYPISVETVCKSTSIIECSMSLSIDHRLSKKGPFSCIGLGISDVSLDPRR